MYTFSPITLKQLAVAGWTQTRYFGTTEYEHLLREEGYPVLPAALQFLSSFGGLYVLRPSWRFPGSMEPFHFQVEKAFRYTSKSNIDMDMEELGLPLCPIGDAYPGYKPGADTAPMLMDPNGMVYIADNGLHDLGTSGEDAIEALCTNRPVAGFADDHL